MTTRRVKPPAKFIGQSVDIIKVAPVQATLGEVDENSLSLIILAQVVVKPP